MLENKPMPETPPQISRGPKSWLALIGWLILCLGAASMGAVFKPGTWYAALNKPSWNPPNWAFAPVWSALYAIMAVAAWIVWRRGGFSLQRRAIGFFLLQLALNAAWSPLFFGFHLTALAFFEILVLWMAIVATLLAFFRVKPLAGWLLLPYLAWVSFASVLNFALWRLNL